LFNNKKGIFNGGAKAMNEIEQFREWYEMRHEYAQQWKKYTREE